MSEKKFPVIFTALARWRKRRISALTACTRKRMWKKIWTSVPTATISQTRKKRRNSKRMEDPDKTVIPCGEAAGYCFD